MTTLVDFLERKRPGERELPGQPNADRLWSRIAVGAEDECWPFMARRNARGYGRFCVDGWEWLAHRYVSHLVHGPIPDGICVLHRCDNPPCCNPAHLWRGTRIDNNRDMLAKGRHRLPTRPDVRGRKNGACKLTERTVIQIRERAEAGELLKALAKELEVSPSLIGMIVRRERWAWLA